MALEVGGAPGVLSKFYPPHPPPLQTAVASMLNCFLVESAQVSFRLFHGPHAGQHPLLFFPRDLLGSFQTCSVHAAPQTGKEPEAERGAGMRLAKRPGRSKWPYSGLQIPRKLGEAPFQIPNFDSAGKVGSGRAASPRQVSWCARREWRHGRSRPVQVFLSQEDRKGQPLSICPPSLESLSVLGERQLRPTLTALPPSPGEGESARRDAQTWEWPRFPQSCADQRLAPPSSPTLPRAAPADRSFQPQARRRLGRSEMRGTGIQCVVC